MTATELLLDMRAAHAARVAYQRAAERLAAEAVDQYRIGDRPRAKELAGWANRMQRAARAEYEVQER